MRAIMLAIAVCGLSGCGSNPSDQATIENISREVGLTPMKYTDRNLIRICKAGAAFRNGRSVAGIDAKVTEEQQVRLDYRRDSDGKSFKYDCLVEGNGVRFRVIDGAGPGTGPGIWSGSGSKTTFKLNSESIEFEEDFLDGSSDTEKIQI